MPALSGSLDFFRLVNLVGFKRAIEILREAQAAFQAPTLREKVTHTLNAIGMLADFTETDIDNQLVAMAQDIVDSPAFDKFITMLESLQSAETFAASGNEAADEPLALESAPGFNPVIWYQLAMMVWSWWKNWKE